MPTITIEYQSDQERLQIEHAVSFVQELNRLALSAAEGRVIDVCEGAVLEEGRAMLRATLEKALAGRIAALEKKGGQRGRVAAAKPAAIKESTSGRC
jgi:hypothetical protein